MFLSAILAPAPTTSQQLARDQDALADARRYSAKTSKRRIGLRGGAAAWLHAMGPRAERPQVPAAGRARPCRAEFGDTVATLFDHVDQ